MAHNMSGRAAPPQLARGVHPTELNILALSDIRAQPLHELVSYLDRLSPRPDLIVYAGDDIARFQPAEGPNYFELIAMRSRHGLVAVAGNDGGGADGWKLITGERVYEVHHRPVLLGDILIVGVEGAPRRSGLQRLGAPLYTEAEIDAHLSDSLTLRRDGPVFLVSHAPPYKVLDRAQRHGVGHIGSRALRDFTLREPRVQLVVCGHCHREGGQTLPLAAATVINAASHDGPDDFIRIAQCHWRRGDNFISYSPSVHFDHVYPWGELMCLHGTYCTDFAKLWRAGITTLGALAEVSPESLSEILGRGAQAVRRFPLLARARFTSRALPIAPLYAPPAPRVYFDIETDPYGGNKLCWLIGILDESDGNFRQLSAQNPRCERRLLAEFADFCGAIEGRTLVSYSGSNFDHRNVIHRMKAHSIAVPDVLNSAVDLLYPIQNALAVPLKSYGLKGLAESLGYEYRHPQLDGFTVAHDYERLAKAGKPITRRLLEYNEDDVRSLQYVVSHVQALCGYGGPPRPKKHRLSGAARRRLGKSQPAR